MAGMFLWRGAEIADGLEAASVVGLKAVSEAAVAHARANHPWRNRTGEEEASIHAEEPVIEGPAVRVRWGADHPALFLELGTQKMPAFPFLRPAADAAYPQLIGHMRVHA